MTFQLDPILAADTTSVARLGACRVLLMEDKTYPWLILVPEQEGLRDLDDLSPEMRGRVMDDIDRASKALKALCSPDKINVAALGNVVAQLHIHVIARFKTDPAWPRPVWGATEPHAYSDLERDVRVEKLRDRL